MKLKTEYIMNKSNRYYSMYLIIQRFDTYHYPYVLCYHWLTHEYYKLLVKNRLFLKYEENFFDETTYMTMVMYRFITSF